MIDPADIIDAATRVLVRDGVPRLTLDAAAREAGISKGGLVYHFPTKERLLEAVVLGAIARFEADLDARAALEAGPPGGRLLRAYLALSIEGDPQAPVQLAALSAVFVDDALQPVVRAALGRLTTRLTSAATDPVAAGIVRLAADGLLLGQFLGAPLPDDAARRALVARLLTLLAEPRS